MLAKLLSKFRKHDYVFVRKSENAAKTYYCRKCGDKYYLPFEWAYQISEKEIKNARGCRPI